jgi:hypothetical protein
VRPWKTSCYLAGMATHSSCLCERLDSVKGLSNDELSLQLSQLAKQKHVLDAELLLYLSEVDRRGLYREQAFSSMFGFCMSRLGCGEDVAYKRVGVARMLRQFPMVFELLAEGRIHMSALMLVRPHLTEDNHREWLLAAAGKSKRQVEMLVARRCPRPDVAAQVRKLPEPRPNAIQAITALAVTTDRGDPALPNARQSCATSPSASALAPAAEPKTAVQHGAAQSTRIHPLSGSSYRVVFTASETLKKKIDRAAELLSHAVSPSDLPTLIERAIDLLIEHEEWRRFATGTRRKTSSKQQPCQIGQLNVDGSQDPGRVDKPEVSPEASEPREAEPHEPDKLRRGSRSSQRNSRRDDAEVRISRYVPAEVRRVVWWRDEGRCTYVDAEGNRCKERRFLEIDHRFPYAIGGASTIENCRLMCRCHNGLGAEQVFGRRKIDGAVAQARTEACL